MIVVYVLLGILIGLIISLGLFVIEFSENGGNLLIDPENKVYRIQLNLDNIEEWGDQKYVILKVSNNQVALKRLADTDPMDMTK